MKYICLFLFLILTQLVWGDIVSREIEILRLEDVKFEAYGEIEIIQGDKNFAVIEAEEKLFSELEIEAKRGVFTIRYQSHLFPSGISKDVKCKLMVKSLNSISLKGNASAKIEKIKVPRFSSFLEGQTSMQLGIETDHLIVKSQGQSSITAKGRADQQKVELSGMGSYQAGELLSKDCDLRILGNFAVTVQSSDEISIYAIGDTTIGYLGNPKLVEKKLSGNAKVIQHR